MLVMSDQCIACGHAVVAWCPEESINEHDVICYSCGLHANSEAAGRIAELEDELALAKADQRRLEWLAHEEFHPARCGHGWGVAEYDGHWVSKEWREDWREAIDAAMEGAQK